ncbi:MAG: hypothetical protein QXR77_03780 [Archaeoglobaceae archaeon]
MAKVYQNHKESDQNYEQNLETLFVVYNRDKRASKREFFRVGQRDMRYTTENHDHKNPFVWTEEKGSRRLRKPNKPLKTPIASDHR